MLSELSQQLQCGLSEVSEGLAYVVKNQDV